jgi:MFS family permease
VSAIYGYIRSQRALGADFGRFWLARTLSIVGDQIVVVALAAYSFSLTHSAATTSVVMMALTAPRLISPVSGAVADRLAARRAMILLDLAQGAVGLAMLLESRNVALLIGGAGLLTVLSTLYLPAGRRSIARLAPPGQTARAYAAIGTSWNIGWAAGPAIGGGLMAVGGIHLALSVDVATFLASALLVRMLPELPPAALSPGGKPGPLLPDVWRTLRAGLACLISAPRLSALAVSLVFIVGIGSVDTIALVTLTGKVFGTGSGGYGLAVSAAGIGMLCGSLAVQGLRRMRTPELLLAGQACVAVGLAATGAAPGQLAAMAGQGFMGLGNGVENIASDVLIQEAAPEAVLGTVSGIMIAAPFLGSLIAYSISPILIDTIGPRRTLLISGLGVLAVALLLRVVLARGKADQVQAGGKYSQVL